MVASRFKPRLRLAVLLPALAGLLAGVPVLWILARGRLAASSILLAALVALAAMAAVALWLDHKVWRPLADIPRQAGPLARGGLGTRLELPDAEEAAAIVKVINQLAARVEAQVESAEAERAHLLAVGESMADGILVTDGSGRVQTVNLACRRLFRVRGEVEGLSVRKVTGLREIEAAVAKALGSGESQSLEVEIEHPRSRTLAITCSVLQNHTGVVVAVRDITEFLLLGQIRRDLVANVSHEFKTPLTAIRGYAETLVDGALEDPTAARLFTERILQQCERLQALLDDLLTLARLERGDGRVAVESVDLEALLEEAAEVLAAAAERKPVTLALELEPATVQGNREALSELCLNLLDNAIKYNTTDGRVTVRLRRREDQVEIEVTDTGYGIPEAAVPRVFERFYRVDRGRSRQQGGTGLGLAIVKHAVEQHGGTIVVESRLGEGSTFRVKLPAGSPPEESPDEP